MDAHTLEKLDFPRVRELLAAHAMTPLGRELALRIHPSNNPATVRRWHTQLAQLAGLVEREGLPPLGGVHDVRGIVRRCAPPLRVSAEELSLVGQTLRATHALTRYLARAPDDADELTHLAGRIGDFSTIADRIEAVIDERSRVRDTASEKLAAIRREIRDATHRVERVIDELLHDPQVRTLLSYPNYTFHQDRFVLPLRAECRGRLPGVIHRTSDSGATLFVEPAEAVRLNNQIVALRAEESEEIARLLWDLAHEVYLNADAIQRTLAAIAVLDLLAAKLRFAEAFELRRPELLDAPQLAVRGARHPLLIELARQRAEAGEPFEVVPIDYRIGDDFDLLVITGPNTGGKTVTLKTVGLLTLMVQAGLPVPVAEGSRFGIFRHVLIDVGDEQSMQQSLSTFSAHLKRQLEMLRKAGEHSLILIDELGAGTDPDEGAAIGRAILDELLRRKARCMVTTHIGALKEFALTRPRAENACVEFDTQTLRPTYHLRIGEPGMSNAIEIAQRLGLPKRLIHAARRNLSRRARALRAALAGTVSAKREAEQARAELERARLEAERARAEAAAARAEFEQKQADFETWVRRVVHLQPNDRVRVRGFEREGRIVRLRIDQHRAEVDLGAFHIEVPLADLLPPETPAPPPRPEPPAPAPAAEPPKPRARRARPTSAQRRRRRLRRSEPRKRPRLPSLSDAEAAALQTGDAVYVKRFHRTGHVSHVYPEKRIAQINLGTLVVEVPFEGLARPPKRDDDGSAREEGVAARDEDRSARKQERPTGEQAARPPADPPQRSAESAEPADET